MTETGTAKQTKLKRREKSELKSRMSNFLMFLPNMLKLLGKLLTRAYLWRKRLCLRRR
jgi:hypothetical protein